MLTIRYPGNVFVGVSVPGGVSGEGARGVGFEGTDAEPCEATVVVVVRGPAPGAGVGRWPGAVVFVVERGPGVVVFVVERWLAAAACTGAAASAAATPSPMNQLPARRRAGAA